MLISYCIAISASLERSLMLPLTITEDIKRGIDGTAVRTRPRYIKEGKCCIILTSEILYD